MKLKISNRADVFFGLFSGAAENMRVAAELLLDMVSDFQEVELKARRIQEREHDGDTFTHEVIQHLNTTFITPMDREDIYSLASALDDVVDAIEAAGDLVRLAQHPRTTPGHDPAGRRSCVPLVRPSRPSRPWSRWTEPSSSPIDRDQPLENEGDRLYRRSVADMFSGDHKAMDVLRWKDVSETLEEALDGLENVANIVEAVVLKHA
jgi:uncharacterized protein Yka (UPF0111/DUF47 family)